MFDKYIIRSTVGNKPLNAEDVITDDVLLCARASRSVTPLTTRNTS